MTHRSGADALKVYIRSNSHLAARMSVLARTRRLGCGSASGGLSMSMFERLLVPGSTERPTCRCGEVMEVASIERLPEGSDAAIRVYRGAACSHEMRLTVWATVT